MEKLLSSSRAFSLSTPTFLLSTHVDNSEATWKKATKCNKSDDTEEEGFKKLGKTGIVVHGWPP